MSPTEIAAEMEGVVGVFVENLLRGFGLLWWRRRGRDENESLEERAMGERRDLAVVEAAAVGDERRSLEIESEAAMLRLRLGVSPWFTRTMGEGKYFFGGGNKESR